METLKKILYALGAPFRAFWWALTRISSLSPQQIKSLVTVGFLAGMISLSLENWGITFLAEDTAAEHGEGVELLFDFLMERMRYISALQAWLALILGAVIIGADYVRIKIGDNEAGVGRNDKEGE